jgi:hypothetical protein
MTTDVDRLVRFGVTKKQTRDRHVSATKQRTVARKHRQQHGVFGFGQRLCRRGGGVWNAAVAGFTHFPQVRAMGGRQVGRHRVTRALSDGAVPPLIRTTSFRFAGATGSTFHAFAGHRGKRVVGRGGTPPAVGVRQAGHAMGVVPALAHFAVPLGPRGTHPQFWRGRATNHALRIGRAPPTP